MITKKQINKKSMTTIEKCHLEVEKNNFAG